ncbi:Hypothetical predicted protein, partial [Pelobates cultripes]
MVDALAPVTQGRKRNQTDMLGLHNQIMTNLEAAFDHLWATLQECTKLLDKASSPGQHKECPVKHLMCESPPKAVPILTFGLPGYDPNAPTTQAEGYKTQATTYLSKRLTKNKTKSTT